MKPLEITAGWFWVNLMFFGFTYSIKYVQEYETRQLNINKVKDTYLTFRIAK